jgi:hypothetical protein
MKIWFFTVVRGATCVAQTADANVLGYEETRSVGAYWSNCGPWVGRLIFSSLSVETNVAALLVECLLSHLTSGTSTKSNLYFVNYLTSVLSDSAL